MITHFYEIFGFLVLALFAIVVRWFVNLIGRWLDVEKSERIDRALNGIIDDAVLCVEEEARSAAAGKKPNCIEKHNRSIRYINNILEYHKISVPPHIIAIKTDAAVHRLFNHERG